MSGTGNLKGLCGACEKREGIWYPNKRQHLCTPCAKEIHLADRATGHLEDLFGDDLQAWWDHWALEFDAISLSNIALNWFERKAKLLQFSAGGRDGGRDEPENMARNSGPN